MYYLYLDTYELSDVKRHLKGLKRWFDLGLELGLFQSTLQQIKLRYRENSRPCSEEMLTSWLKQEDGVRKKGGANWPTLVSALRTPTVDENDIADAIEKERKDPGSNVRL